MKEIYIHATTAHRKLLTTLYVLHALIMQADQLLYSLQLVEVEYLVVRLWITGYQTDSFL